jgi:putative Mg2+ transporter-C (MgtC) family protein
MYMYLDINELRDILTEVNVVSIIVRVFLAMLLGGILGLERGIKNRPAGFRTHMLVCLGATLVMMTNQYIFQTYNTSDPARLGAQVVSGIGFLGAGTIIVTKRNQIKGLTTAAGLWTAACLGLAIGIGFYMGAILGGIAVFTANTLLHSLDDKIRTKGRLIDIYIEFSTIAHISGFMAFLQENDLEVQDMLLNKGQIPGEDHIALILSLKNPARVPHGKVIQLLSDVEGIQYIEEL